MYFVNLYIYAAQFLVFCVSKQKSMTTKKPEEANFCGELL